MSSTYKNKKRIFYFDALRALAIISVIIIHIFFETKKLALIGFPTFTWNWAISDIMGNCFRCGVDLFLMLSGALSLGRVWDIKSFLSKRIPRIVLPFLFWGIVLSLFLTVLSFEFPQTFHYITTFDFQSYLTYLIQCLLAQKRGFTPYWFFWMILGTYFIMPIFNKWLYNADLNEAEYFLVIWLITCLFEYTLFQPFPITLTYFTGPIGMVVLGYYLRHTQRKIFNNPYISLLIVIIGASLMVLFSYMNSTVNSFYIFQRYSIFLAIEVTGIFLLFKNFSKFNIHINFFENPNGIFRKSIFSIAKYSYGIYLIHRVILIICCKLIKHNFHMQFKPLVLTLFILTLGISLLIMAIMNRIPYINQIIGAK